MKNYSFSWWASLPVRLLGYLLIVVFRPIVVFGVLLLLGLYDAKRIWEDLS